MRNRLATPLLAAIVASIASMAPAGAQESTKKTETKGAVEPKAEQTLKKMTDYLAKTKSMSFSTDSSTQVVTKEGQKIDFVAESKVSVQRPNKLRSDRVGQIVDMTFRYDGKQVALFGKRAGFYAMTKAPATIDETIDFSREKLGIEAPAADLLMSNPYRILMEDVVSGMYVGKSRIRGTDAHHLAFRGNEVDWQIWIADGPKPMPLKYVIVSKNVEHSPEFEIDIRNWKDAPKFEAGHFAFEPPKGAQRIAFAGDLSKAKPEETRVR